jgi:predicted transcriptional regulator
MFSSEKQLVNKLKLNYSVICNWDTIKFPTYVLEEVDLGFGIADLVISKTTKDTLKKQKVLSYFDITIYKIIESNCEVSFNKIKEITRANETSIKRSLDKLMLDSYINQTDTFFNISKSYKSIATNSIAIEAKLKNWKRALNQAFRYKWFASKSYVVLDSNFITPALLNIEEFKKYNVGLAEINKKGHLKIYFNPKSQKPIDDKMYMLLNEQLRQYLLRKKKRFPSV